MLLRPDFAQYHREGTPVVRPMPLVAGFGGAAQQEAGRLDATASPYAIGRVEEVKGQYMLGDALLAAPVPPGVKTRRVVLTAGRWYDFYTGQLAGENETIEVTLPLSQIPLFVKDGGLIPLIGERQWTPAPDEILPLEVRHDGELPGQLLLYDDDGEIFNYEKGDYCWTRLSAARDGQGVWRGSLRPDGSGKRWRYSSVSWTFMTKERGLRIGIRQLRFAQSKSALIVCRGFRAQTFEA